MQHFEEMQHLTINPPYFLQALTIINKFGGARSLSRALAAIGEYRNPSTIYKWTYARDPLKRVGRGGTGGIIPSSVWPTILKAAHYDGIVLTKADFELVRAPNPYD